MSAEYSAVPNEMKKVAEYFGKEVLEQCKEDDVIENVKAIREFAGDRAVLRAFHFFEENKRVDAEVEALEKKDFATFFTKSQSPVILPGNGCRTATATRLRTNSPLLLHWL